MHPFLDLFKCGLETCGIAGHRLVLAVSGGADSVALLRGMLALRDEFRLRLFVAHLNHRLRGEASANDAEWVRSLCSRLDVPVEIGTSDVAERARLSGLGLEEAARAARYEFLEDAAARFECTHVAVAHTADDQAETILHHVIRGTGMSGMRGMRPARPLQSGCVLVRPMLSITREAVEAYLQRIDQPHRQDASNADPRFTRSRVRLRLIPLLEQEFNPQVRDALRRLGRQAGELQDCLEVLARGLLDKARVTRGENECRMKRRPFIGQPRHLIRESFALLWRDMGWPKQRMGFEDWDRLATVVLDGKAASLPGNVQAECPGSFLVLHRE